jgi:cyclic pyranopterin phosphate synthase
MDKSHLLTYEEITRFLRIAAREGIRKVRITGGEPLSRREIPRLIRGLADIPEINQLALSTNAVFLEHQAEELKQAGLHRVNISLDSLQPERFKKVTGFDRWHHVMRGIEAALRADLHPVKVNCVLVGGVNDDEIPDFVAWARREPVHIRFIEYMPVGTFDTWTRESVVSRDDVLERLRAEADLIPKERDRTTAGPAEEFTIRNGRGSVGLITAVTNEFCEQCNRIRLTSDGKLRGCLMSNGELDLQAILRSGASDDDVRNLLLECIRNKPEKHYINEEEKLERPAYQMHQMGG